LGRRAWTGSADGDGQLAGLARIGGPARLLVGLTVLAAGTYAIYELQRYARFDAGGFDLGIFDQVVWHYAHFQVPASSIKDLANIWGDHFSPILAVLAPLYWIWDDPRTLLLAQAVLLAAAAWPIFMYARPRVGDWPALVLAAAYLVFWGVQSAIGFDFHELAFAPLLGGVALLAADRRSWGLFFAAVVGLLAVKEDQSLVVVALGLYLLTLREWRPAFACIALGAAWYVLVVKLLIPAESPSGHYVYFSYGRLGSNPVSLLWTCLTHPVLILRTAFSNPVRAHTIALLYLPILCLPLLSRTVIIQLPLLAERFLSTNPSYWNTGGQYTLAIAAVLFIGATDGICTVTAAGVWLLDRVSTLSDRARAAWRRTAVAGLAVAVLALEVIYAGAFPLSNLFRGAFWSVPPQAVALGRVLNRLPAGLSVAAEDMAIPRLAHRQTVAEITSVTGPTDYIVADVLGPAGAASSPAQFGQVSRFIDARLDAYAPVGWSDGWLVLRSHALAPRPAPAALAPLAEPVAQRLRRAEATWSHALAAAEESLVRCYVTDHRPSCYVAGRRLIAQPQAGLTAALLDARPGSSPGCRELSAAARRGSTGIVGPLEALAEAGARRDAVAARGYLAEATVIENDFDATGLVARFVDLCARS
jgi:uncharacterized membrane protein